MEAFAASSAKLFLENHSLSWSHHRSAATPHHRRHALRLSPPCQRNTLHVAAAQEPQVVVVDGDGVEEVQSVDTAIAPELGNVRVRFELRKEISFGQRFLMVGDDPVLGLWDPLNAVPLNWSDGHVWALEMDVPCKKVMKYKFILKVSDEDDDDILWQPGPDRVLETWETQKTITVSEDWDDPELQTIMEEDHDSQLPKEMIQLEGDFIEETQSENGYIVPDNALLQSGEKEVLGNAEIACNTEKGATLGRRKFARLSSGEAPVLIPGLTPLPADDTEQEYVSASEKHIQMESSEPYLKEEPASSLPLPNGGTEIWSGLYEEKEQPGNFGLQLSVVRNDFRWGLRTIRQFLAKLYTKMMS